MLKKIYKFYKTHYDEFDAILGLFTIVLAIAMLLFFMHIIEAIAPHRLYQPLN